MLNQKNTLIKVNGVSRRGSAIIKQLRFHYVYKTWNKWYYDIALYMNHYGCNNITDIQITKSLVHDYLVEYMIT